MYYADNSDMANIDISTWLHIKKKFFFFGNIHEAGIAHNMYSS